MAVADLKAIIKDYLSEQEGDELISDARIDQLLASRNIEAFRGKIDTNKLVDAMAFQK